MSKCRYKRLMSVETKFSRLSLACAVSVPSRAWKSLLAVTRQSPTYANAWPSVSISLDAPMSHGRDAGSVDVDEDDEDDDIDGDDDDDVDDDIDDVPAFPAAAAP